MSPALTVFADFQNKSKTEKMHVAFEPKLNDGPLWRGEPWAPPGSPRRCPQPSPPRPFTFGRLFCPGLSGQQKGKGRVLLPAALGASTAAPQLRLARAR